MPAPERTSLDAIVAAGRALLDARGLDGVTMQAVASAVGVQPPSLYKRVRDREHLVRLVGAAVVDDLASRLEVALREAPSDPRAGLIALGRALRAFAHEHPAAFGLVFGATTPVLRPDSEALRRSVAPVLEVTRRLAGEQHALDAARTITAWANGFLTMELAGAFQLGGDVDAAFEWGLERVADAVAR